MERTTQNSQLQFPICRQRAALRRSLAPETFADLASEAGAGRADCHPLALLPGEIRVRLQAVARLLALAARRVALRSSPGLEPLPNERLNHPPSRSRRQAAARPTTERQPVPARREESRR